ncbi:Hypothetical predicted protein, partial [Pelobates cultripes]
MDTTNQEQNLQALINEAVNVSVEKTLARVLHSKPKEKLQPKPKQRIQTPLGLSKPDLTNGTEKGMDLNPSTVNGKRQPSAPGVQTQRRNSLFILPYRSWTNGKHSASDEEPDWPDAAFGE